MDELRRMDLNLLLALHALLAERHVTRAALRLHRSQPAVSHALAQLREVFQDPLLVREGARLTLTPTAQALVRPLDDALRQLNGLLRAPTFDAAHAHRQFRLALSDYAAQLVLPGLMRHVRQHAPTVDIAVTQASRQAMLAQLTDGEIDVALGVFPTVPDDIARETLFDEQFVSVADRRSLPARGRLSLTDWLARPHVLVAMRPGGDNEIDMALAAEGLSRRVALVLPHWQASTQVLAGTDLVLTVASRTLDTLPRNTGLRAFAPPLALPGFAFHQAWHERRQADPGCRWLRDLIRACTNGDGSRTAHADKVRSARP
ncbi:LysR family transcriptional regulator [Achromobacter sp. GG226]|uniref:LysR family transcriptional regulator n=1 Tax=Verticiella alkaliphila TaxID=2779529 RepID=UPI001C0E4661|nr:LysR family transcriptional regulator [Verticiella sp. GG226]MBU4609951.1 LysR family transcriptional regulator [Verticiella sp. GG226]